MKRDPRKCETEALSNLLIYLDKLHAESLGDCYSNRKHFEYFAGALERYLAAG